MRIFPTFVCLAGVAFVGVACARAPMRGADARAHAVVDSARVRDGDRETGLSPEEDVLGAMPRLLKLINLRRRERGVCELNIDRGLALVAQQAATEYQRLGRGAESRVATQAHTELRAFSLVFAQVFAMVLVVERLDDAESALVPALDPNMRFVGMSVTPLSNLTHSRGGGYAVVVTLGS